MNEWITELLPLRYDRENGQENAQRCESETYHPLQRVDSGVLGFKFALKPMDQIG